MNIAVLPDNYFLPALLSTMEKAKDEICLSVYHIKYKKDNRLDPAKRILDLLVKKATQGVKVKVLIHAGSLKFRVPGQNMRAGQYLSSRHVEVRYWKKKRIFHAKTLIVDRSVLIVGSHNLSNTSLTQSVEMSIKLSDVEVGFRAFSIFTQWWSDGVS